MGFEGGLYDVAIIGDYNIGGDAWSSRILLEEIGLRVVAQWSGDGTLNEMMLTPQVKLNLVHCYRLHQPPHGRNLRYSLVRI